MDRKVGNIYFTELRYGLQREGFIAKTTAKRDFAVRSDLVPHSALFASEQLTEVYRSIFETLEDTLSPFSVKTQIA